VFLIANINSAKSNIYFDMCALYPTKQHFKSWYHPLLVERVFIQTKNNCTRYQSSP